MIEYFCDKNGEPINVRRRVHELARFTVTQGTASDGKNIYMIFERKKWHHQTHRCKIVKLDAETLEIKKISDELRIGHGNDLTYRDGILYITHSAGNKRIHRVDARTLKQLKGIDVTIPKKFRMKHIESFNGIACFGKGYMLRVMYGSGILVTDENFKAIRYFHTEWQYRTSQGMDQKGRVTYRAYSRLQSSDKNLLVTFDDDGCVLEEEKLDITGELESVFFVNDQLCGSVYRKTGTQGGRKTFAAYLFRIY